MSHETRSLKMHEELLMKVIRDQACNLEKAILEGVMNSIEAGSDAVRIKFDEGKGTFKHGLVTLEDDGCGIVTEEELINHFETFGTPHSDDECTIWKRFRMGRGQLFAYGKNTWRTATFEMVVDIKHDGLTYKLKRNLPTFKGTTINVELYDNPFVYSYASVDALADKIKHQIEYMPGKILFNGTQLNTPADAIDPERWTEVDENAYYLFGVGNKLTVYNLGAYVMDLPATDMGVTGVVVSRKKLDVNFARGGVHNRCEVYQQIKKVIKKHKPVRKVNREYLEDWEKINMVQDLRDGDPDLDLSRLMSLKVFRTSSTRSLSLNDIKAINSPWTFAPLGDRAADKLMQSESCVCIDDSILDQLNYTGDEKDFWSWLVRRQDHYFRRRFDHLSSFHTTFRQATTGMNLSYKIIPADKWSKREKQIVKLLNRYEYYWKGRRICIGVSGTALAWTDGDTYIALERTWLRNLRLSGPYGVRELLTTMCHELAHDERTDCTHIHGEAFYRHYHDITMGRCPLDLCSYFASSLKDLKNEEHHEKAKEKERKATAKVKAKLGLDQPDSEPKSEPTKIAAREKVAKKAATKVNRRRKGVGRIPAGALAT